MALFLKYQEGGETPKYSLYGEDYDFHDLERRVYEGFNDFASTIKYGKKNHDSIYSAVKDLMKGLESGRVTFENGTFIDHEGQYHNESKEKHDNYGIAAAWILLNMSLANKITPPTPETKEKYDPKLMGRYILTDIFDTDSPTTGLLESFWDLDELNSEMDNRSNKERIKMLKTSIDKALANFDTITSLYDMSDELKAKVKSNLEALKNALSDNILDKNEYLILNKTLGDLGWNTFMRTDFSTTSGEELQEDEDKVPEGFQELEIGDNQVMRYPVGTDEETLLDEYIRHKYGEAEDGEVKPIYKVELGQELLNQVENGLERFYPEKVISDLNSYHAGDTNENNIVIRLRNFLKTNNVDERNALLHIATYLIKKGYATLLHDNKYILNGVTDPNNPDKVLVVNKDNNNNYTYLWIAEINDPSFRDKARKELKQLNSRITIHKKGGSLKFDGGGRVVKGQAGDDTLDWWKNAFFGNSLTGFDPNDYIGEYMGYTGNINSIKPESDALRNESIKSKTPHGSISDYTKPQESLNEWAQEYYAKDADTKRAKNLEYAYQQWLEDDSGDDFLEWYNNNLKYLYNYRKRKADSGKKWYTNDAREFNEIYDKLYHYVNEDQIGRDESAYDWYGTATALRHFDRTKDNLKFNLSAIEDEDIREALENLNINKATQGFIYNNPVAEPEETPEETPQPVEEKPEEKKPEGPISKTDPRNATLKRQGIDWGNLGRNLLPEGLAAGRLAGTIANNNRAYKILNRALHPYLQNTYERYSPITGEFGLMLAYNLQAADYNRLANRNATSDASFNFLAKLDANRRANQLREQGFLKDNDEAKRTATEALLRQEDNVKRRTEVANENRKAINLNNWLKAQLKAERVKQNWDAWNNYLSGIEQRVRTDQAERKQAYRTFSGDVAKLKAQNAYDTAMQPWKQVLQSWAAKNPGQSPLSWDLYQNYLDAMKAASNLQSNIYFQEIANSLGLKYNPNTYSLKYKKGGKLIKRKK